MNGAAKISHLARLFWFTNMAKTLTNWQTPKILFKQIDHAVGNFAVDAAASAANTLCPVWYGPGGEAEDALEVEKWLSPAWCNPPYGKGLERWLDAFNKQVQLGGAVVALLPAYVERIWWLEKVVNPGADIIFLTRRVQF